jgi:hypothetical protein
MTSRKNRTSTKSPTVSRERFDKAIADIYRERAALAEMRENTVTRKSFDRAISDIRRLRAQLDQAYAAGAAAVLNSEVFNEYVPASTRRNLRPGRFGAQARRSTQG